MEPETRQRIFVVWDARQTGLKIQLQALAKRPPAATELVLADLSRSRGDFLQEVLLPGLLAADRALFVVPSDLEALPNFCFELGLALGLGKEVGLAATERSVHSPLGGLGHVPLEVAFRIELDDLEQARLFLAARLPWSQFHLPPSSSSGKRRIALCPRSSLGAAIRDEITNTAGQPGWSFLPEWDSSREFLESVLRAEALLWIVTPVQGSRPNSALEDNNRFAFASGLFSGRSLAESSPLSPPIRVLRSLDAWPIRAAQSFEATFGDLEDVAALLREESPATAGTLKIGRIEIENFKSLEHLTIDLTAPSSLDADWTCIAGINGAGKTSILQAVCLALLGEGLVQELGSERLRRTLRRVGAEHQQARLSLVLRDGSELRSLVLPLGERGLDDSALRLHPEYPGMKVCWERLQRQVLVSYGASRNLSDHKDSRFSGLNRRVQRQMTLFDPLTQVASIEVLLEGGGASTPVLRTLRKLLAQVLTNEIVTKAPTGEGPSELTSGGDRLLFQEGGTDVEAIDLPDGFRSTIAWLADLCAAWHEVATPEEASACDPAGIRGIVLVDEIDLHLHPRLQRELVPRLRKALPQVQFIVTTHSPLVLSSFDRNELVILDRQSEGGVRELDRQILGFSTDQIFQWLMDTPPQSTVIEEKLEQGDEAAAALLLYQSEDRNEAEASAELARRKGQIEELRRTLVTG